MFFHQSHLWFEPEGLKIVTGLTFYGQAHLGTLVCVDLPKPGLVFSPGDLLVGLESRKTVWELKAPWGGRVLAVNQALREQPSLANESPFERGWLLRFEATESPEGSPEALTDAAYQAYLLTLSEA